jgi:hypothetical protein
MASSMMGGGGGYQNSRGMALTPEAYSAINANRSGSSQYGYNPNTGGSGALYGSQGPTGVTSPINLLNGAPNTLSDFTAYQDGTEAGTWDTPEGTTTVAPTGTGGWDTAPAAANPNQSADTGSWDVSESDPNSGIAYDDGTV